MLNFVIQYSYTLIFLTDKHLAEDYAEASNCKQAKFSRVGHNHLGIAFINMKLP